MADQNTISLVRTDPDAAGNESEALLRIANAIAAELGAVASPHWHDALVSIQQRLAASAARRHSPDLKLTGRKG